MILAIVSFNNAIYAEYYFSDQVIVSTGISYKDMFMVVKSLL